MDNVSVRSDIDTLLHMLAREEFSTSDVQITAVNDDPVPNAGVQSIAIKQDDQAINLDELHAKQDIQTEILVNLLMKQDKQMDLLVDVTNLAAQMFLEISKSKMGTAFVGSEEETGGDTSSGQGGNVPGGSAPHILGLV